MPCGNGTVDPTLAAEEHSDRSQVASSTMFELVIALEVSDEFVFAMEAISEHTTEVKRVMAVMARQLGGGSYVTGHVTFVLEVFHATGVSAHVLGWLQLRHSDVVLV